MKRECPQQSSKKFYWAGMLRQRFDGNWYRKQKSCNHLITTLLWVVMDSNHRSKKQQIYSLPHLATLETTQGGGRWRIRTADPLLVRQML